MLILSDIALSYDPNLSMSYCIRASYYSYIGNDISKALEENDKALRYNQNDWFANYQRGDLYSNISLVKAIEIAYKAAFLASGTELNQSLCQIGALYCMAGFPETGNNYFLDVFKMEGDSAKYSSYLTIVDA
jgi:tetratricopeptide (TPR) repeat protein